MATVSSISGWTCKVLNATIKIDGDSHTSNQPVSMAIAPSFPILFLYSYHRTQQYSAVVDLLYFDSGRRFGWLDVLKGKIGLWRIRTRALGDQGASTTPLDQAGSGISIRSKPNLSFTPEASYSTDESQRRKMKIDANFDLTWKPCKKLEIIFLMMITSQPSPTKFPSAFKDQNKQVLMNQSPTLRRRQLEIKNSRETSPKIEARMQRSPLRVRGRLCFSI
ncbi:hypothetical protein VNO77_27794 [Canavalia gladiata]|uniref:Uncharacterized protein n=1 Tax=Canavalia gladiata TaxID=3824 RepID=A0AAN9KZI7_CANGL